MLSPLGKAIRKARVDTETTQNELAQFLGFSTAFLSYLERGIKSPPVGINEKLKEFFVARGLDIDFSREIAMFVREIKVNYPPLKGVGLQLSSEECRFDLLPFLQSVCTGC